MENILLKLITYDLNMDMFRNHTRWQFRDKSENLSHVIIYVVQMQ